MRRTRRSRISKDHSIILNHLVKAAYRDSVIVESLSTTYNRNRAFGRLLHKWITEDKESVIDMYVDEDALMVTGHALNILKQHLESIERNSFKTERITT